MKFIIAIIQPHRLDAVREALLGIGINGLTVTEVRGYGRQKGQKEIYRGAEYTISFVPKLKIEIAVVSERVEETLSVIQAAARSGKVGDGKIFVLDLLQAVRARTARRTGTLCKSVRTDDIPDGRWQGQSTSRARKAYPVSSFSKPLAEKIGARKLLIRASSTPSIVRASRK